MLQKIKNDLLQARKNKDKGLITILSTLVGEIENKKFTLKDKAEVTVLKAFLKGAKENYERTNSDEHLNELNIYTSYLPKEIPLEQVVEDMKTLGLNTIPSAMKELKAKYGDSFDGKVVKEAFTIISKEV
jgi:uncharacterized protein YqeY